MMMMMMMIGVLISVDLLPQEADCVRIIEEYV